MAAIIRNGAPVIHSAIVNEQNGLAGGEFVTLDAATNMVTKNGSTWDGNTYLTVNVAHDANVVGDDATVVVHKGELIGIAHLNPGDEAIVTGMTEAVGAVIREAFVVVDELIYDGLEARAIRCIKAV